MVFENEVERSISYPRAAGRLPHLLGGGGDIEQTSQYVLRDPFGRLSVLICSAAQLIPLVLGYSVCRGGSSVGCNIEVIRGRDVLLHGPSRLLRKNLGAAIS